VKTHSGFARFYSEGVLRFVQHYVPWTHMEYYDEGSYEATTRALKTIEELDVQQRVVKRITMVDGGKLVESVDVIDPATAAVVSHVAFDKEGKGPIDLPPEILSSDIKLATPVDQWKAEEAKVSALTNAK
jgi:hypothetical protein